MKIRVIEKNVGKIEAALADENGGRVAHTFTSFKDVKYMVERVECRLESLGLPVGLRVGASATIESSCPASNAYKYIRDGTHISIKRTSSAWFLVGVTARKLYTNEGGRTFLYLSEDQDAYIIRKVREQYSVLRT